MDACRPLAGLAVPLLCFALLISAIPAAAPRAPVVSSAPASASAATAAMATIPVPPTRLFRQGQVLANGTGSEPDALQAGKPTVLFEGGLYKMWYFGCTPAWNCTIDYATSADGHAWTKRGAVLVPFGTLEQLVAYPSVVKVGSTYWLYYSGYDFSTHYRIFAATSVDGVNWTREGLVLDIGAPGSLDSVGIEYPNVLYNGTAFTMWYTGIDGPTAPNAWILRATSSTGLTWTKRGLALPRGPPGSLDAYMSWAAYVQMVGTKFEMMYNGNPSATVSDILYAESSDGIGWQKRGLALTALPGVEDSVGDPAFLVTGNRSWSVWYGVPTGPQSWGINLAISDAEPPTTHATATGTPGRDGWYVSDVIVALDAHDNMSGINSTSFSVDSGPETAYSAPFIVSEGMHTVTYRSTDGAANVEANRTLTIGVDRLPPISQLQLQGTPGNSGWYVTSVTLSLSATDDVSGVANLSYSLDGGPWRDYAAPLVADNGVHIVLFRATDVAGNRESTNAAVIKVDTTAPVADPHIHGVRGEDGWYVSLVTLNFTTTDGGSGVSNLSYRVDGGPWQPYTASLSFSEGNRTVSYRATDAAGNVEATHTLVVAVDTSPPSVQLSLPGHATGSFVASSWSGSDSVSGLDHFELSVDGGDYRSVGTRMTENLALSDGAHTIRVRAVDVAGNAATATANVTVDTNPLSLSGPYSGIPTFLIIAAVAAVVLALAWRRRSKRSPGTQTPPPPPQEPPKGP